MYILPSFPENMTKIGAQTGARYLFQLVYRYIKSQKHGNVEIQIS